MLTPDEFFGCKRLCAGTGYYETFNRDNVSLIDVSNLGIERLTETGLRAEGVDYDLDAIVYATGFDAMTGSVTRIKITGTRTCYLYPRHTPGHGIETGGIDDSVEIVVDTFGAQTGLG